MIIQELIGMDLPMNLLKGLIIVFAVGVILARLYEELKPSLDKMRKRTPRARPVEAGLVDGPLMDVDPLCLDRDAACPWEVVGHLIRRRKKK